MKKHARLVIVRVSKATLAVATLLALYTLVCLGVQLGWNYVTGRHDPIWEGPVMGVVFFGAGTLAVRALSHAERRGWIKTGFWPDRRDLARRKAELAAERERILQEARSERERILQRAKND